MSVDAMVNARPVQKKGHLPIGRWSHSRVNSNPEDSTAAEPRDAAPARPVRRILIWSIVALAVLVGLYLYFRYGDSVTPVLGLSS